MAPFECNVVRSADNTADVAMAVDDSGGDAPQEDLGATKVLDETEAPTVTFADGDEKLGEGEAEEDVADENELQRLIEAVREGDQARAAPVA